MTDRHEFDAQAVAYALDALDATEAELFLDHLRGCDRCAQSVSDTHETAALLVTALLPAPRAPVLGERLLAALDQPRRRTVRSSSWRRRAVALAAAVVIGALAGWGVAVYQGRTDSERLHAAPHARLVELRGRGGLTLALSVAATSRVVTHTLPANDPARTEYVLWGIDRRQTVAIGTFDLPTGQLVATVHPVRGRSISGYPTYAVSREPGRTPPARPSRVLAEGRGR